jgi:hypothetical protein
MKSTTLSIVCPLFVIASHNVPQQGASSSFEQESAST